MSKPKWLIAGGMGMVGRNLVKYLIDNNLASDIRVADKKAKFMAFLSADHKAAMDHEMVECIQADCSDDEHLDKVLAEARSGGAFDYVVNCAAETDHTKAESFMAKIPDIAAKLGRGAVAMGVKKFVQVSSAFVYAAGAKPSAEGSKLGPWTTQAEYMLKAEEALRSIAGLPLVVLRPAIIYGPGDAIGLMPRAVIAAAYKRMKEEKMEFLWGPDLKLNTVHVFDVVRAVYFAARKVEAGTSEFGAVPEQWGAGKCQSRAVPEQWKCQSSGMRRRSSKAGQECSAVHGSDQCRLEQSCEPLPARRQRRRQEVGVDRFLHSARAPQACQRAAAQRRREGCDAEPARARDGSCAAPPPDG